MDLSTVPLDPSATTTKGTAARGRWKFVEILLLLTVFGLYAGQSVPGVNESHYLTKAKQFWDSGWCSQDIFIASSRPHLLFYATVGWLTLLLPLPVVAWIGRIVVWGLLAVSWQQLSRTLVGRHLGLVTGILFITLTHQCHLAGEWVVGGVEAKGFAFPLIFWALAAMLQGRWNRVWILMGAASAFHVLVGGWSCLAALAVFAYQRHQNPYPEAAVSWRAQAIPLLVGGVIALLGVVPPLLANSGTEPDVVRQANMIMVTQRLSHHQLFGSFATARVAWFSALLFSLWMAARTWRPTANVCMINQFAIVSLLICLAGIFLSGQAESAPLSFSVDLLIWYWFRLSDIAVPLAATFTGVAIGLRLTRSAEAGQIRFVAVGSLSLIVMAFGLICFERWSDPRPLASQRSLIHYENQPQRTHEAFRNWEKACRWIRDNTPEDSLFLTPAQQQTFKWYAHRAEVVSWKDVPQDATGILEWKKRVDQFSRVQLNYPGGLWAFTDEQLLAFAKEYRATHIMTLQSDLDARPIDPPGFTQIYPKDPTTKATFVVFELKAQKRAGAGHESVD